jgi:hypothetical protein
VDCAKALHAGAVRLIALEKELRAAAQATLESGGESVHELPFNEPFSLEPV